MDAIKHHIRKKGHYMGFAAVEASIARRGGVRDPAAVAASIGRKKYGAAAFQAMAARGRKH